MIGERSLRVFVEVYQTGNIHLAAQRLYISPQSVSKTILALEAELGAPLFLFLWGNFAACGRGFFLLLL